MKHKDGLDMAAVMLLLLAAVAVMVVPVALVKPQLLAIPAVLVLIALCVVLYQRRRLRAFLAKQLCSTDFENSRIQYSLTNLPIATVLVNDGRILWYNGHFREQVLGDCDAVTRPVDRVLPELDLAVCSRPHGQDLTVGERRFTAYSAAAKGSRGASLVYLIDDTFYKETLDEYNESRPACLIIVIDSYDELFDDMKDSEQAKELESINSLLEEYIGHSTGFLRRVSNSRYIAVVEERDVRWMLEGRFDILDRVRALHPGGLTTLSIGVGHGGKTLQECHQMARESIDIALGRGGDQAAVKTVDGFEFYGGISHGVEKRSHVRSRIIANALCDLIRRSDSVIIMGHRMSDLDAIGSAIGALRICKMCGVPAVIAVNSDATLAGSLLMASRKTTADYSWWCTRTCLGFGLSVMLFSLSRSILLGIILAAPVGFCMVTCTIACNTLMQTMSSDASRSRIMALYTLAIVGIPPFGSLLSGKLGDIVGTSWALFICGIFCTVTAYYYMKKIDKVSYQILRALKREGAL